MVLTIIAGATVFGHFLAITRIPYELANVVQELPLPDWGYCRHYYSDLISSVDVSWIPWP